MKKTDELLKKKLIKQIQAISDNTHKSFSAFAFAAATAARDTTRLFASEIETGDFLVRPDVYARTRYSKICDAIETYIELVSVSEPYTDLLSDVFHQLQLDYASQAKRTGQFHTPSSLANGVARFMGSEIYKTEMDLCCGMGALALARAKYALEQGKMVGVMKGVDIDPTSIAACFAQLAYNNLKNPVFHTIELKCMNAIMYYGDEWDIYYHIKLDDEKSHHNAEYLDLEIG
ncbi:N-6 DNA methylase [Salmonella enterica subsp. enterica serovar Chailey]|uniref:N-6 DNA methylase n=1 Tax=Enterobacter hormaechei TaxID=158836 RepID=UPI0029441E8D|nr:N-6 DNA methylase [Salmonella enterica subsp. enterica serovar Chailey]HED3561142.1 N-6 DNA methylase [Klebsiella pneumoniae]EDT1976714.1 N-6 DNA methylase [Salmonella enterica subsp. enterica serovar Chailey]EHA9177131.1 N-6 DNA methylase [Salmonella enterica subsp. enterica serovar Chailey]HED3628542.1 N-6 DNA methylase [Klebsiella pneumoniae]